MWTRVSQPSLFINRYVALSVCMRVSMMSMQ